MKQLQHQMRLKETQLINVQSEKSEAEQVAVDMQILMLQMEDAKATMVTQLRQALQAQAVAEARSHRFENCLRHAGLCALAHCLASATIVRSFGRAHRYWCMYMLGRYTEEYSSAELELQRVLHPQSQSRTSAVAEDVGTNIGVGVDLDASKARCLVTEKELAAGRQLQLRRDAEHAASASALAARAAGVEVRLHP